MAYIFPINPVDGQLYPLPAVPGALQYQWSSAQKCWLIYSPLGVQSVTGILPLVVNNPTDDVVISINEATINAAGSMSAADKAKLDGIPPDAAPGTVTQINTGSGLSGGPITLSGTIDLEPATKTSEGGVIIGDNIDVDGNGVISIPAARFGVQSINVGPGLVGSPSPITTTGTISAALATRLTVGSVRVGPGISVSPDGTIAVSGSLANVGVLAWASIRITNNTSPPQFQLLEGFNISSIVWGGSSSAPRVRLNFSQPLANASYGFTWGATSYQFGGSGALFQVNQNITVGFKTASYVDLQLLTFNTTNWTTGTGNFLWNAWSSLNSAPLTASSHLFEFDVAIIDTQNF
jgi:hypothetical protein